MIITKNFGSNLWSSFWCTWRVSCDFHRTLRAWTLYCLAGHFRCQFDALIRDVDEDRLYVGKLRRRGRTRRACSGRVFACEWFCYRNKVKRGEKNCVLVEWNSTPIGRQRELTDLNSDWRLWGRRDTCEASRPCECKLYWIEHGQLSSFKTH